jgi:nucleotide-binding universal stress UspA family protein
MARLLAAVGLGETPEWTVATARYLQGGLGMPAELLLVVPSAYFEALARGGLARYLLHRGEVPVLLRLAQDRGADLLVLGSKARSAWRHRLGRMVGVLVQESPLPLLVVLEAAVW